MADLWDEAANEYKTPPLLRAAPSTSPDDDWKIWQADKPMGPPEDRGFVQSFVDRVNPIPAIQDWYHRPEEMGKMMTALSILRKAKNEKRELSPEEQQTVDAGMKAHGGGGYGMEGNALSDVTEPGIDAARQAKSGDVAGAVGTLAGGYAAPMAVGYGISRAPKIARAAVNALTNPVAQDVVGLVSPRLAHAQSLAQRGMRLADKIWGPGETSTPQGPPQPKSVNWSRLEPPTVKPPQPDHVDLRRYAEPTPTKPQPEHVTFHDQPPDVQPPPKPRPAPNWSRLEEPAAPGSAEPQSTGSTDPNLKMRDDLTVALTEERGKRGVPYSKAGEDARAKVDSAMERIRQTKQPAPPNVKRPTPVQSAPVESAPAPPVRPPGVEAYFNQETTGLPVQEHMANRQALVNKTADAMHKAGITQLDLDNLDPTKAPTFWRNVENNVGASRQRGYTHTPETIDAIKDKLGELENNK